MPPPVSGRPTVLDNIAARENIDTRETERQRARRAVEDMKGADLSTLRTQIEAYNELPASQIDEQEKLYLDSLMSKINEIEVRERERAGDTDVEPTDEDQRSAELTEGTSKMKGAMKKIMKLLMKLPLISTMFKGWVKKNPDSIWGNMVREIKREEDFWTLMATKFGATNIKRSSGDAREMERLQRNYDAISVPEGQTKMSFETYYTKKMDVVKRKQPSIVRLRDVVDAPLDEEAAQEDAATTAAAAAATARDAQKMKENMESPEVRSAVNVYALARAIKSMGITVPGVNFDQSNIDKDIRKESTHYAKVAEALAVWLEASGEPSAMVLGITIDGGDLEETNKTAWFYDRDIIPNFRNNLVNSGEIAVDSLIAFTNNKSELDNTNITAQAQLPKLVKAIESERNKITSFTPEPTPEPTPTPTPTQTTPRPPSNQSPTQGSEGGG